MKPFASTFVLIALASPLLAQTKTWDGKHNTENIELTMVYFVPSDRTPLPDWRERVDYYSRRIALFHAREFQGQSTLKTFVHPEPLVSESTTAQLRRGDPDAIFYRTLRESDQRLDFARGERPAFPILLALSDVNWRPLDDFYRLHQEGGKLVFEGYINREGHHFPFARSGGARATYLWTEVSDGDWSALMVGAYRIVDRIASSTTKVAATRLVCRTRTKATIR